MHVSITYATSKKDVKRKAVKLSIRRIKRKLKSRAIRKDKQS